MKSKWIIIALCIVATVATAISIRLSVPAVASAPADQTGPYKVGFMTNTYYDSTRSDFAGGPSPSGPLSGTRPRLITTEIRCRPLSTH